MEEDINNKQIKEDPRKYYLKYLGLSIKKLCTPLDYENRNMGCHFNTNEDYVRRLEMIKQLHASAMEVIETLNN